MNKGTYKTKQLTELESYLMTVPGEHVTVGEICAHFKSKGETMGTATVYRHLERMIQEGKVAKYSVDGTTGACFEYLSGDKNCHKPVCYHCKCEECGRLIHLQCGELNEIRNHLLEHHGFTVDPMRTVFYGICEECGRKRAESEEA